MALRIRTMNDLTPVAQAKLDAAMRARNERVKQARSAIKAALTGKKPDAAPVRYGRGEVRLQALADASAPVGPPAFEVMSGNVDKTDE